MLELGAGFAFVGRQYRLDVDGQDYPVDLLFYHLRLRCYVVIELKATAFRPEYAGQLNFYVSAVDSQVRSDGDNPTIGLLLCQSKSEVVVEYSLRHVESPIGVSQYQLVRDLPPELSELLPSAEDIAARVAMAAEMVPG